MKKRRTSRRSSLGKPIAWLPIDSRLIPPIFSFGHVKGWARIFLEVEIVISVFMVAASLVVVALSFLGSK